VKESNETDEQLIDGIKRDDYVSYSRLFVRYYQSLCRFVYGMTASRHDTEDIVQDVFLYLWNDRKRIHIHENVSGYLYKMAKNRTLNHIRQEINYKTLLENQERKPYEVEEDAAEADEYRMALYDCIDRLSTRCREILLMHRIKGFKQKEIAEQLNISLKTVKNQIWISLQKLKTCIEHKGINL
jgi:RNA polymerase sigma-70 factor (ECF subfamily)